MNERVSMATVHKVVTVGLFEEVTFEPGHLKDEKGPVVDDLVSGAS